MGALIYVCFAFLFFKTEKFSILKIVGEIIGFCGIVAINYNPNGITFAIGDILIIGASICTVIANVISKKSVQGSSPYWITGISQFFGGIVLFVAAAIMGADFLTFNLNATWIFAYICIASISSYTLWYYVLKNNSLSKTTAANYMSSAEIYPVLQGANLIASSILAQILLKEKINKKSILGMICSFIGLLVMHI